MLRTNSDLSDQIISDEDLHHSDISLIEDDLRDEIGDFSVLPDEIIVSILKFLEYSEIEQNVSVTSSYFWETCSKHFFDSLYGRSLRFNEWQKMELKRLNLNLKSFQENHQITLFRPTNRNFIQNLSNYFFLFSAILILLSAYTTYKHLEKKIEEISSQISANNLYIILPVIVSILSKLYDFKRVYRASVASVNIAINDTARQNNAFLRSAMTSQHLNEIKQFINENKIFLSPRINQIIVGRTTISQLLKFIERETKTIERLSKLFSDHLESKKTTTKRFLDEADFKKLGEIDPELPSFARNAAVLWRENNNKKESLIAIEDDIDENINSQSSSSHARSNSI